MGGEEAINYGPDGQISGGGVSFTPLNVIYFLNHFLLGLDGETEGRGARDLDPSQLGQRLT